jgi:hypothetical protein
VLRWIAEDKKFRGTAQRIQSTTSAVTATATADTPLTQGGQHAAHAQSTPNLMAEANRLCRRSLPELRNGLDADGGGGWRVDGLSARSRADLGGDDGLRSLRTEGGTGTAALAVLADTIRAAAVDVSASFSAEFGAVHSYYATLIAAARQSLSPRDIAAAVRSLLNQKCAAMRALTERSQAASRAQRESKVAPERPAAVRMAAGGRHPS